jgi:hypothetical protein
MMPAITDTFNSFNMIGWYGSAYLLAISTTYPIFVCLYPLSTTTWAGRGLAPLLLVSIALFGTGNIRSYLSTGGGSILIGRVLSGVGAAGSLSGIAFLLKTIFRATMHKSVPLLALTYAISFFIGPM